MFLLALIMILLLDYLRGLGKAEKFLIRCFFSGNFEQMFYDYRSGELLMASPLTRFSISIENELLEQFLAVSENRGYENRSEAIRDLIRESLVREEWASGEEIVGTITIVYDHQKRELSDKLTKIQHAHHDAVLAATHIHLDHDNCMEMIAVKGKAEIVRGLADALISARGVMHGRLSATTTGKMLK